MNDTPEHEQYNYQEEEYGHNYAEGEAGHEEYAGENEYGDENYDQSQLPIQGQKKSNLINLAIFGGVGIVIVVMGYFTLGPMLMPKAASPGTPADASALMKVQASAPTNAAPNNNAPIVATAPMPAQPAPAPAQPAANAMGVSPAAPVTNEAANPVTGNPNDPWSQAANGTVAVPPSAPANPAPVATTTPTVPATMPAPAAAPTVNADAQKLQELQQKLSQVETERQDQAATITELQNRLAEAETKVTTLQQQLQQQAAAAADGGTAPPVKTKIKSAHATKSKETESKGDQQEAAKTPQTWELRSASDGTAWVSRASDNQLYRVAVGDELPGVGRITAIRQQGDSWVVVGTSGQIRQN